MKKISTAAIAVWTRRRKVNKGRSDCLKGMSGAT
jgi:hypothetical protein